MTPERLAEIRDRYETGIDDTLQLMLDCLGNGINVLDHRTKGRDNWIADIKRYQADHVGLLAEVDRLSERVAELEAERGLADNRLQTRNSEARALAHGGRKYADQQRGDDGEWIAMHEAFTAIITALDGDATDPQQQPHHT